MCRIKWLLLILAVSGSNGFPSVRFGGRYSFEETVLIQESEESKSDVGYSVRGELKLKYVNPKLIWAKIEPVQLYMTSKKTAPVGFAAHASALDEMENKPFLIETDQGIVKRILVSQSELPPIVNLKKGLASLFQFQTESSTMAEVDSSGKCKVKYVVESDSIVKEKSDCYWTNQLQNIINQVWGNKIDSFRRTVINLGNDNIIDSIKALEQHTTRSSLSSLAVLGIKTEIALKALDVSGAIIESKENSIEESIRKIEIDEEAMYIEVLLEPEVTKLEENLKVSEFLDKYGKSLQESALGSVKSAWALVKSAGPVKKAQPDELYSLLSSKKHLGIRHQLIDIFGTVQTNATHQAALKFLKINTKKMDLDLCERYLWALSTSPNIKKHIIKEIHELVESAQHPNPKLWQTLIMTLPAMAHRFNERCNNCDAEMIVDTIAFLNTRLNKCPDEDEDCQLTYLRGLLNIPHSSMKSFLVEKALSSKGRAGVLSMRTIERMGPQQWDNDVLRAAEQIFLSNLTYDSSSRCIALDILLQSKPSDNLLHRIMSVLKQPFSSRELKEYMFQRLNEISLGDSQFAAKVKHILIEEDYNHYHYLAQGGFSTAFSRDFMRGGTLSTSQEVSSKILKRGNVHVNLEGAREPVFTLGLFSSGLGSFVSSDDEEGEGEPTSGGLELNVLGVGLRPFIFFDGHGELMGHVWSGTASTLTPAFQALMLLEDNAINMPLGVGYSAGFTTTVGASVDLSGQIEISLWHRNAESLVRNRAGLAFESRIDLDASYVKSTTRYNLFSEPELHLTSQIQFSGAMALCLQLQQPESTMKLNTFRSQRLPDGKHQQRRAKYRKILIPGKTFSLNAKNNEKCSEMLSE